MNLFRILSSNDGSIQEPHISSVLAYLLDPNQDHGLSNLLLKSIVEDFRKTDKNSFKNLPSGDWDDFTVLINPEFRVDIDDVDQSSDKGKGKHRDIDIVIEFRKAGASDETRPLFAICIENKINDGAIQNQDQLGDELNGIKRYYEEKTGKTETEVYFCFLTLTKSKKAVEKFSKLDSGRKLHLLWKTSPGRTAEERVGTSSSDESDGTLAIQDRLTGLLERDGRGEIDPIPGDSAFLIKSFIAFIRTNFKDGWEDKQDRFERKNYGKTIPEHFREFIKRFGPDETIKRKNLLDDFTAYVREMSGVEPNPRTMDRQLRKFTVNDQNRVSYQVTEKNHADYDLVYYSDGSKRFIKRWPENGAEGITPLFK